jgi:transposase-like protein
MDMIKRACSGTSRLSKGSLLSIMGDAPFRPAPMTEPSLSEREKDRILSVVEENGGDLNRVSVILGISASSLKRRIEAWESSPAPSRDQESTSPTRRFFERTKSPWSVRSFDPSSREVCVEIKNPYATTNFSYTIPSYKISD